MADALSEVRRRLASEIDPHPVLPLQHIVADPWVVSMAAVLISRSQCPN